MDKDLIDIPTIKHIYGLNTAWIKKLGRPQKLQANQTYGFPRQRVETYLRTHQPAYFCMLLKRAKNAYSAQFASNQLASQLLGWARIAPIELLVPLPETLEELKQATEIAFRADNLAHREFKMSVKAVLGYVRHHHCNYHDLLQVLNRQPGFIVGYLIIKHRVNQFVKTLLLRHYGLSEAELYQTLSGKSEA
jgi:hypothetical protein